MEPPPDKTRPIIVDHDGNRLDAIPPVSNDPIRLARIVAIFRAARRQRDRDR